MYWEWQQSRRRTEAKDVESWLTFQGLIVPFKEKTDHDKYKEQKVDVYM